MELWRGECSLPAPPPHTSLLLHQFSLEFEALRHRVSVPLAYRFRFIDGQMLKSDKAESIYIK